MTQFTLSQATQTAINTAINNGPGTNNANYVAAYNAIYNNMVSEGGINAATLYWFSQAGSVNGQASHPTAAGTFIWAYTQGAAASEGYTVTTANLQAASNAIASTVFKTLQSDQFVFNDANVKNDFGIQQIISDDAGTGIKYLQGLYPNLDYAVWGGTLFARTSLQDSTYFSDYPIQLVPDSRDANAILQGLFAGATAVYAAGGTITKNGAIAAFNLDLSAIDSVISGTAKTVAAIGFVAAGPELTAGAAIAAGVAYIWDVATGADVTLTTSDTSAPGVAYAYEPSSDSLLTFNQGTAGAGTLTLSDGTVLTVGGTADLDLTNVTTGSGTDEQALLNYLSKVGDPLTAAQLDTDNYNYLNPTTEQTAYLERIDTQLIVNGADQVDYQYAGGGASPNINGQTTEVIGGKVYPVYNFLAVDGIDFARSTLTNIQDFHFFYANSSTTLTLAQFNEPIVIAGVPSDTIIAATGGTFDLTTHPASDISVTASDWSGTTLIGNAQNNETLTASLFGNDALQAGNGTGDTLVAGEGVDTMTGGTGGDTFVVGQGLAVGSVVKGNGTGNVLKVATGSDISGATVTDIQTLSYSGSITVSSAELSEFSSIVGNGTITVADAGTVAAGSTLKVTGVVTTPALAISGGGIVVFQGGTLTGIVTVNSGALMIGYGTINGADTINGTVVASGGALNITGNVTGSGTLTVASSASTSGSSVSISSASVNAGGSWTVSGADSVANLTDNGTITVASGGSLDVSSALSTASTGTFQLTTKGSLEISAILGAGTKIQFLGTSPTNELTIDSAAKFGTNVGAASYAGPLLESFAAGDIIDLKGIVSTGLGLNYSAASGDLQITGSTGNALATLAFQNSTLGAGTFHTASDGVGGTLITHS